MALLFQMALLLVSGCVAIGLCKRRNMWPFIVAYWLLLTAKNATELILMR